MLQEHRKENPVHELLNTLKAQALGMWRFRWIGIGVAWAVAAIGWVSVYAMPDIYEANARVYVDTENAIQDFLGGIAAPNDVMNEVTVVVREMVSRPNLAEVARNTDLALRATTDSQFDNLLTSLQQRISVSGTREGIYSISFDDADRQKALAVVDTLLTAFVEKSLGADRTDSAQAQKFLEDQISEYEARLTEAEDKLANFKRDNVALMPGQGGDYFSRLQAAESSLQAADDKLRLAIERRAELQRQIEGEEPVFGIMSPADAGGGAVGGTSAKIRELELELADLRLQYTDKHPQIGRLVDTIEMLKAQDAEERIARNEAAANQPLQQNPLDLNPVYQNMRIQLSNVEVEIASLRAERGQQQQEVTRLKRLVDTIPQVEAELNRLNRDYDVVKAKHQQLLQQLETANIGEDVSRSIDEIQFRVIDPPFADLNPVGPNRPLLMSAVLVLAIGASLAAAFLLNLLRPTFIGHRSVTEVLGVPVLASVSLLQSPEQKARERRNLYSLQAASALLIVSFSVLTFFVDPVSRIVRELVSRIA